MAVLPPFGQESASSSPIAGNPILQGENSAAIGHSSAPRLAKTSAPLDWAPPEKAPPAKCAHRPPCYLALPRAPVTPTTTGIPSIAVSPVGASFATTDPAEAYLPGKEVRIRLGFGTTFPRPSSDPGDLYELASFSGGQGRLRRIPGNALASPVTRPLRA